MFGTVWTFKAGRFTVALRLEQDYGYQYDGDDPEGEVQEKLDSGEYVAFDAAVTVTLDGVEVGADYLGGSVYAADDVSDFWTAHRDPNPANRNSSANPRGAVCIGHYFPDMVHSAVQEARDYIRALPRVRAAA